MIHLLDPRQLGREDIKDRFGRCGDVRSVTSGYYVSLLHKKAGGRTCDELDLQELESRV